MLKKLRRVLLFFMAILLPVFFVLAGNIENSDPAANLEIDDTDVLFVCDGCDVEVTDTEISGLIWGSSLGWVNLQPSDGGVFNTRLGVVSGNAWGSISGWVNFEGVFIDPNTGEFDGEAFSQNRGPITFECPGSSCVVTTWRPYGCTDPSAQNHDETATVNDGSCLYVPEGCTDEAALNYDPLAGKDDGSCEYPIEEEEEDEGGGNGDVPDVLGCMDIEANNFHPFATLDDGSCLYGDDIPGCMDPESPLFDPDATVSDPEFCFVDFYGCMDPSAENFDPDATILDNSCEYAGSEGCTDITALNYSPSATSDDGSCLFDSLGNGCTNPDAINYNPDVTEDNGTCIFSIDEIDEPPTDTDGDGIPDDQDPDADGDGIPDDEENPEDVVLDGDTSEGQEFLDDVFENLPGVWGEGGLEISNYIARKSGAAKALALALLIASLLQTLPFREGNLLFSFFSIYKTRKYWGTVYDSITKQPLDPAYVTLFDEAGQAIDTCITDIDGRYSFIVGPGKYFLSAQKTDYQFPSQKLIEKTYDELYTHLYFGGAIELEHDDEVISRNIPMDPLRFNWNEYAKQKTKVTHFYRPWHRTLTFLARVLFVAGFIFAIWVFVVVPSVFAFVVLSLYILTIVLKILGLRKIPRGYIKDKQGFALSFGIVRVYSQELNREVKHTIVGAKGHYLLLVPNGRYYMTVEQKLSDGSYKEVHRTKDFRVRKGFIAKKLTLHEELVVTEEEKFQKVFSPSKNQTPELG